MVLLSLSEFGKCGGHPYLWSGRWRALVESTHGVAWFEAISRAGCPGSKLQLANWSGETRLEAFTVNLFLFLLLGRYFSGPAPDDHPDPQTQPALHFEDHGGASLPMQGPAVHRGMGL